MSRTHCCLMCERGEGHDSWWCCATPSELLRQIELPDCYCDVHGNSVSAHYILHEPDWDLVRAPAPALLFLHGAMTYLWPETLYLDVLRICEMNSLASQFIIIAPLASIGEPLAVVSEYRTHADRFENDIPYVDSFEEDLTWECFLAACDALGQDRVDWTRLCITGFSMGAQAAWGLALSHGSLLATVVPMAGSCLWPDDAWEKLEVIAEQVAGLPLRAFSCEDDTYSYNVKDFAWLAKLQWFPPLPVVEVFEFNSQSVHCKDGHVVLTVHTWGDRLALELLRGTICGHNCWDLVYESEETFGLFKWMATTQNPKAWYFASLVKGSVALFLQRLCIIHQPFDGRCMYSAQTTFPKC